MAEVRFEVEHHSLSQCRISNQSLLLGVEIEMSGRALLMMQGCISMDVLLIHRYEDYLRRKE